MASTTRSAWGFSSLIDNWQARGACTRSSVDMTPNPRDRKNIHAAKTVCAGCPVKDRCLDDGIGEKYGVRGGYTEDERRRLRQGKKPQPCAECGISIVPAAHQQRCGHCNLPKKETPHPLAQHHQQIAAMLARPGGCSWNRIAVAIGSKDYLVKSYWERYGQEQASTTGRAAA